MEKVILESNTDLTLSPPFRIGNELYSPDSGNVSVVVKDVFGDIVANPFSAFDAELPQVDFRKFEVIEGKGFAHYFLEVKFQSEGLNRQFRALIEVLPFLPLIYTSKDVLELVGVTESEVSLTSINLNASYGKVTEDLGITLFQNEETIYYDNQLILYQAALDLIPTLPLKALQKHSVDDHTQVRSKLDIEQLESSFRAKYDRLKIDHYGFEYTPEALLTLVATSDIVTGN